MPASFKKRCRVSAGAMNANAKNKQNTVLFKDNKEMLLYAGRHRPLWQLNHA
jgi:hypothetical protein